MINIERIKRQVQKAINTLPTVINLKRLQETDDGYGGKTTTEISIPPFNAFIEEPDGVITMNINIGDNGKIENVRNIKLYAVFDNTFEIKENDYFTVNNKKYRVRYAANLYNILWQCDIEVI